MESLLLLFLVELWALFQQIQSESATANYTHHQIDESHYPALLGQKFARSEHLKQFRLVIVWKNPYQLPNATDSLLLARQDSGNGVGGGGGGDINGDVDGSTSGGGAGNPTSKNCGHQQPCRPGHTFDEMEQRDLIRTVIYLANGQINVKFKLCDLKRFRSDFRPQWNLYRCSARFTVTVVGKDCDNPEHCYDGYATFIVQNPELPPLLAIRYYVFQFLYEAPYQLVKKLNQKRDL